MPSPLRSNRPPTLLIPHRKLSRPWLVKLQEELWRDGPSGDGPEEDFWSRRIPPMTSFSQMPYKTYSPSPDDFFSETEPFPTIIDTMMEESSFFGEEFISRKSMPFEGPSSLLNSFIFRPSLPLASASSEKTPTIDESANVLPSWMEDSSYLWKMSYRQAVSETPFGQFAIVPAISATHIYSEVVLMSSLFPPRFLTNVLFTYRPEFRGTTASSFEVPLSAKSTLIRTLPDEFYTTLEKTSLTSYDMGDVLSIDTYGPLLASQKHFLSSYKPDGFLESNFYSSKVTELPYISVIKHSFGSTAYLNQSSSATVKLKELFDQTDTFDYSFDNEELYGSNLLFYTKTSLKSFSFSNIQTPATVVNDDSSSKPISTVNAFSTNYIDFSSPVELDNVNTHIPPNFTDFSNNTSGTSSFSIRDVPSGINVTFEEREKQETPQSDVFVQYRTLSELNVSPSYQEFTYVSTLLFDNVSHKQTLPPEITKLGSEELNLTPSVAVFDTTNFWSAEKIFPSASLENMLKLSKKESLANQVETDEQSNTIFVGDLKSSRTIKFLTPVTSRAVYSEEPFPELFSSTGELRVNYPGLQEMTPIPSVLDITSTNDEKRLIFPSTVYIDPSTHHVTVRSLNDHPVIDAGESISPLSYASVDDSDTGLPKLTSLLTLSPVIKRSGVVEYESHANISSISQSEHSEQYTVKYDSRVENPSFFQDVFTKEYTSISLQNNFSDYRSLLPPDPGSLLYDTGTVQYKTNSLLLSATNQNFTPIDDISFLISPTQSYIGISTELYFTVSSEIKSENTYFSSDPLSSPVLINSEAILSDNLFSTTKIITETMSYHESRMPFGKSLVHSLPSFRSRIQEDVTTTFSSESQILFTVESLSNELESAFTYTDIKVQPTKTFTEIENSEMAQRVTFIDETSKKDYVQSSRSLFEAVDIESSMSFPYASGVIKSKHVFRSSFKPGDYVLVETPSLQLPDESMTFSSHEPFIDSNKVVSKHITSTAMVDLSDYILSLNIPWTVSRIIDYPKKVNQRVSITSLLSHKIESVHEPYGSSAELYTHSDATLKYFISEPSGEISDFDNENPLSNFETRRQSETSFVIAPSYLSDFESRHFTPRLPSVSKDKATVDGEYRSSVYSEYVKSSPFIAPVLTSEDKLQMKSPSTTMLTYSSEMAQSGWINGLRTEKYLQLSESFTGSISIFATSYRDEAREPATSYEEQSWSSVSLQDISWDHSTRFPHLISFDESAVIYSTERASSKPTLTHFDQTMSLILSPSADHNLAECASGLFSQLDSGKLSDSYSVPGRTASTSMKRDNFYSTIQDSIEESTLYNHGEELTPRPSTPNGKSSCGIASCSSFSHTLIPSETTIIPMKDAYSITNITPTLHTEFTRDRTIAETASGMLSILSSQVHGMAKDSALSHQTAEPKSIQSSDVSLPKPETKSIHYQLVKTYDYSIKKSEPASIESDVPIKKLELKSSESDFRPSPIRLTPSIVISSTAFRSFPTSSFTVPASVYHLSKSISRSTSRVESSPALVDSNVVLQESSKSSYDIEMASVLAISSFFGMNSSRNASSGFENSGMDENEWSKSKPEPTPSFDLTLFKDDHFWILTGKRHLCAFKMIS